MAKGKVMNSYKYIILPLITCHINKLLWQNCVFSCNLNSIGLKNGVFYELLEFGGR